MARDAAECIMAFPAHHVVGRAAGQTELHLQQLQFRGVLWWQYIWP
jgi:hypothetical protein